MHVYVHAYVCVSTVVKTGQQHMEESVGMGLNSFYWIQNLALSFRSGSKHLVTGNC